MRSDTPGPGTPYLTKHKKPYPDQKDNNIRRVESENVLRKDEEEFRSLRLTQSDMESKVIPVGEEEKTSPVNPEQPSQPIGIEFNPEFWSAYNTSYQDTDSHADSDDDNDDETAAFLRPKDQEFPQETDKPGWGTWMWGKAKATYAYCTGNNTVEKELLEKEDQEESAAATAENIDADAPSAQTEEKTWPRTVWDWFCSYTIDPIKNTWDEFKEDKTTFVKDFIISLPAKLLYLIIAAPSAFNSLFLLGNKTAEAAGKDFKKWWNEMSQSEQAGSILFALSSFYVNYKVAEDYTWSTIKTLWNDTKNAFVTGDKKLIALMLSLITLSTVTAVSAAQITKEAFAWLFDVMDAGAANFISWLNFIATFLTTATTRVGGFQSFLEWCKSWVPGTRAQEQYLFKEKVEYVTDAGKEAINKLINDLSLSEKDVVQTLTAINILIDEHPEYKQSKHWKSNAYGLALALLGLLSAMVALGLFGEKFDHGLESLNPGWKKPIENWSHFYQILLGILSGGLSGILYWIRILELQAIPSAVKYCYEQDKQLLEKILNTLFPRSVIATFVTLSATNLWFVLKSLLYSKDNHNADFTPNIDWMKQILLPLLLALGIISINVKSVLKSMVKEINHDSADGHGKNKEDAIYANGEGKKKHTPTHNGAVTYLNFNTLSKEKLDQITTPRPFV